MRVSRLADSGFAILYGASLWQGALGLAMEHATLLLFFGSSAPGSLLTVRILLLLLLLLHY
jgi:hypothetical protein